MLLFHFCFRFLPPHSKVNCMAVTSESPQECQKRYFRETVNTICGGRGTEPPYLVAVPTF